MYAGTHPRAKIARERRIEQAKRHDNERIRRNAERIARVANAAALTDEIAIRRLCAAETSNPDDAALFMLYANHTPGDES